MKGFKYRSWQDNVSDIRTVMTYVAQDVSKQCAIQVKDQRAEYKLQSSNQPECEDDQWLLKPSTEMCRALPSCPLYASMV